MNAKIPVFFFQEGDKVVAYSPALDLSTCGKTEHDAEKRFAEAVAIFFEEIKEMGTVDDVLEECGWVRTLSDRVWSPPKYKSFKEELIKIPSFA